MTVVEELTAAAVELRAKAKAFRYYADEFDAGRSCHGGELAAHFRAHATTYLADAALIEAMIVLHPVRRDWGGADGYTVACSCGTVALNACPTLTALLTHARTVLGKDTP